MSIETLIQENTQALRALTDAINAMRGTAPASEEKPKAAKEEKPKAAKTVKEEKQPEAAPAEAAPVVEEKQPEAAPAEAAAPVEVSEAYTYEEVADLVRKVATTKGRDAAVALLTEFGVQNAKQLGEEHWPAFVAKAEFRLGQE